MTEDVAEILCYADIARMRLRLRNHDPLSAEELQHFAGSIVSSEDAILLKDLMKIGSDAKAAGDAAFALFVRGGIGRLNTEIRQWFESGDEDSHMTESAPLILAGCVRELDDGTALRQLFEFADIYDVNVVLTQVLADADELPLERILRQSISEQVDRLIEERGKAPSNRFLWTLRTYGQIARVRSYLCSFAVAGHVAALASYVIHEQRLGWNLLIAAKPKDAFEMRLVVNIALENVARGGSLDGSDAQDFIATLPTASKAEFLNGLSAL